MPQMLQDLRYALRSLRHNPGFALTAIISIAFGIGVNSAIFSYADGMMLRPIPVPDASGVYNLRSRTPSGTAGRVSYPDYLDFRDKNQSFSGLVAYDLTVLGFAPDQKTQAQMRIGLAVSGNFFQALGTEPRLGRGFRPDEDKVPGRDAVVVLGNDLWKNEFHSDPSVIGRHIRLSGLDFTVIGVASESFTGMDQYIRPAVFVPAMMAPAFNPSAHDMLTNRAKRAFEVKGRLKSGVSREAASAEIAALAKSLEQSYPSANRSFSAAVETELQSRFEDDPYDAYIIGLLFFIVMITLGIACANVANLMLSRARAQAREIAVRLAIGANRVHLIRQFMLVSLIIAVAGGALGLSIALAATQLFSRIQVAGDIPIQFSFQLDGRVLGFTAVVAFLSAMLFGLIPALQATKTDLVSGLKAGEADLARKRFFGRSALVTVQIAGSLVLLVVATQLYRGCAYVLSRSPGFRIDHMITMRFDPALVNYTPAQTEQFYKTLTDHAAAVPGVKSAALTSDVPMTNNARDKRVIPESYEFPRGQESVDVLVDSVDSNYFGTFGVPLIEGRGFRTSDRADSPRVVVVNEKFAQTYLGGHAIGKRIRLDGPHGPWAEVVGVTVTGKHISVFEPPFDYLYLPLSQDPQSRMTLMAETYGDPASLAAPLQQMVHSLDANLPVFGVRTIADLYDQRSVQVANIINEMVASVGFVGLGLALVGLYAVVSYQVARRTREIGIRMAIGARQPQVMWMMLKQAAIMGLAGVAIGLVLSFAGSRALSAALGMPAFDPVLFTLVPLGLFLTTLLAAAIPARRAAQIDPMTALRQD
jgi:macrolide transport system ATP-binding/permease protein